jgi:hypothetical protein
VTCVNARGHSQWPGIPREKKSHKLLLFNFSETTLGAIVRILVILLLNDKIGDMNPNVR